MMCNYFSCIITRDLKVVWDTSMKSHEELIKKAGLKDDKLIDRDFVRIEILPIGETYSKLTRNKKDWFFKIDEEATLPEWFKNNKAECVALCWTAWSESVKVNIALNDEEIVIKGNDFVYACDNSSVIARDNSSVNAYGNSRVDACDNSSIVARGNSSVIACGNSSVDARDNSSVDACDNSSVIARDNSSVNAYGNSRVDACDNSSIVARGNSSVDARGNSSVDARDNSSVIACDNSSVEAYGFSSIHKYSSDVKINLKDNAHIFNHLTKKVEVLK